MNFACFLTFGHICLKWFANAPPTVDEGKMHLFFSHHGSMVSSLKNVSTLELWELLFLVLKVLLQEINNHLPYSDAAWTREYLPTGSLECGHFSPNLCK